jgi:PurA-like ssDNA and RNA-binding protein
MISNERPSPHGSRSPTGWNAQPIAAEDTIKSGRIQIERKLFIFTLKENPRGRFLRITEEVSGRRDTIIVPATGLEDFRKLLETMIQAASAQPAKHE